MTTLDPPLSCNTQRFSILFQPTTQNNSKRLQILHFRHNEEYYKLNSTFGGFLMEKSEAMTPEKVVITGPFLRSFLNRKKWWIFFSRLSYGAHYCMIGCGLDQVSISQLVV